MAFALRITANTINGREVKIEPSWWNLDELRSTYNFRKDISDYYFDYYLDVDKQTFQDIMESQEKFRKKDISENKVWIGINDQTSSELEHLVKNLKEDATIQIWIYEWESGLD